MVVRVTAQDEDALQRREARADDAATELALEGVSKWYDRVCAVDGFALDVAPGELVALLGPSGCGKTTTLRIIAGFVEPDEGRVLIRGGDVTGHPPDKRDIGMVFQSYGLFPHMTVEANVGYGLKMRKVGRAERRRRSLEALEMVQLADVGDRYPHQLSGGQQQRVALARAVVIRPSVLLLDEPLSNLDAHLREEMRWEIRRLQQALRITTVVVTHDQDEALAVADRIVVMNQGRIEQIGTPEEIYRAPRTPFVASFIGECNFWDGKIGASSGAAVDFETSTGLRLLVSDPHDHAPGDDAIVSVRPEAIALLPSLEEARAQYETALAGAIEEATYLGATTVFRVRIDDGTLLRVTRQNRPEESSAPPLRRGDEVAVAWIATGAQVVRGVR
jgi:putative spermidine/putrescine transport system ATP-binding protein